MLARQTVHARLFYEFDLETHIPSDHLLRGIDRFLELDGLHEEMHSFYSHTGRPSIDPELMIRMLVVGYVMGLRSERRLCAPPRLRPAHASRAPAPEAVQQPVPAQGERSYHDHPCLQPSLMQGGYYQHGLQPVYYLPISPAGQKDVPV